jgi:hypothetical protein
LEELSCSVRYDPALSGDKGYRVRVPKKIQVFENGIWAPYPTVSWLDNVEYGGQLMTRVLAKITGEEGLDVMNSPDGVPDGALMIAAKKAGIHTYPNCAV